MCRISTVSDDWATKGFHIHIEGVELVMRPDHLGRIVFKKFFRSTSDASASQAIRVARNLLDDPQWRTRFLAALDRGSTYLLGVEGELRSLARGRTREFKFLRIALERWETG
jgi:hypothetical protein